jgi:hypothetical protein
MKNHFKKVVVTTACFASLAVVASADTLSFTTSGGSIPTFPSTLTLSFDVSGLDGNVSAVSLSLSNFTGISMNNTRLILVDPNGTWLDGQTTDGHWANLYDGNAPSGGFSGTYTFTESAATAFDYNASTSGGTYRPEHNGQSPTGFAIFSGESAAQADGTWTLIGLAWNSSGGQNQFDSARLTIETVPEPGTWALMGLAGFGALMGLCRKR